MGRSDKIEIMNSLGNKVIKNFHKLSGSYIFAETSGADIMILTEYASQITSGKKYGARSVNAAYRRLLPKMRGGSRYPEALAYAAETGRYISLGSAVSRANITNQDDHLHSKIAVEFTTVL